MQNDSLELRLGLLKRRALDEIEMANIIVELAHSVLIDRDDVRSELVELVMYPDCGVRSEAMGALAYHGVTFRWESETGKRLFASLTHAVKSDADSECRRAAAGAIGSFFRDTGREDVLQILAEVCLKEEEAPDVRAFAYVAILDVSGVPKNRQPSPVGLHVGPRELDEIAVKFGAGGLPRA